MNGLKLLYAAAICALTVPVHAQISGLLDQQTAVSVNGDGVVQSDWQLDLEWNGDFLGGSFTRIARIHLATETDLDDNSTERQSTYSVVNGPTWRSGGHSVALRELYWDRYLGDVYLKLGKQQVVWGEADGIKLLDVINPQSFREFILDDFDDSRIPLWMLNAEWQLTTNRSIQLLLIPDTTVHELAAETSPFRFTSPAIVPSTSGVPVVSYDQGEASGKLIKDGDAGVRVRDFVGGWDVSLNYLYHTIDVPVIRTALALGGVSVEETYERSHLIGGSASTALGDWILRTEVAYETDRYQRSNSAIPGVERTDELASVIGVDWQGWTDQFVSLQWIQRTAMSAGDYVNARREDTVTLFWESNFWNETASLELLSIHSLNRSDGVTQLKFEYNWDEDIDVFVGTDVFFGDSVGLYGQFDGTDRVTAGITFGF